MKKSLILLTAVLGAGPFASAQGNSPALGVSSPEIREFLNSPAFIRSIVAAYGVDAEINPKPENPDITAIQGAEAFLRSDTLPQLQAGASMLEQYMTTTNANPEAKYSAIIPQLVGSIYFRLSTMASGPQQNQFRDQARRFLTEAIEMFPSYRAAHKNLARIYFQMGDENSLNTAARHFTKAIELGDREASTFVLLSKIYFDQEKFAASEAAARQGIMMDPSIKETRTILAYALFQQERFDEAKAVFEEMLQDDPNNADIWQMIANTYIQKDLIDEAAKRLEIVRFMGKANADTLLLLGDVYMNKNMVEDAAEAYAEGLTLSTRERRLRDLEIFIRPIETLNNFQAFNLALGLLNQVNEVYSTTLTTDQRNDMLALRSEINIAMGDDEEGANNLKQILSTDPMNRRALLSLGQYYSRLRAPAGDPDARQKRLEYVQLALDYYGRAQQLIDMGDDQNIEAARQAYIGAGQLLAQERRLPEALEALEDAQGIRREPRIASYIEMIQRVLATRG
jgi:pentatricopeptide repeat protein